MKDEFFLIDTHIFILLFNDQLAANLPQGKWGCSIVTEMELRSFPKLTTEEDSFIREMLTGHKIYNINDTIKEKSIFLRRTYRLKLPDAIIAATAIAYNAILLTNDRELHAIPELQFQQIALKP